MNTTLAVNTDRPGLLQPRVSFEVPLPPEHRVTLHGSYPHDNLGQLVRNLVASKARHEGADQAEALRQALLRQVSAAHAPGQDQWVRAFVLVTHAKTQRIESAGVLHARLRVTESEPGGNNVRLVARLGFSHSHMASSAKALGATAPAARLFAAEVLRRLSFDCKDVFVSRRRPVSLVLELDEPVGCSSELREALSRGLHSESWRIASWRGGPLSL